MTGPTCRKCGAGKDETPLLLVKVRGGVAEHECEDVAECLRRQRGDDPARNAAGRSGPAGIRYVWLAKRNQSGPADVLGVFGSPERAKRVCQDSANEYLGERSTPALTWQGDDTSCSASYHHPAAGMQVFTIEMYELDKVQP